MSEKYTLDGFEPIPEDGVIVQRQYVGTGFEVNVPKALADHHNLYATEVVVRITADDGSQATGGQYIGKRGRFRITERWRNALGIGTEDYVKLEILDAFRDNPDWTDV